MGLDGYYEEVGVGMDIAKILFCAVVLAFIINPSPADAETEVICIVKPGSALARDEASLQYVTSTCGEPVWSGCIQLMIDKKMTEDDLIPRLMKKGELLILQEGGEPSLPVFPGQEKNETNMQVRIPGDKYYWWARQKDVICRDFEY